MTSDAGKTIFISGVGRGLGREIASQFIEQGNTVYGSTNQSLCDLDLAGLLQMDLADEPSIKQCAAELAGTVGSLDILVNCAGVDARAFGGSEHARGPFDVDAQAFNAVFNVNVTGPMTLTTAVLPLLRKADQAMVVNVSSQLASMQVAARKGRDTTYCVSKAALNMLTVKTAAALRPEGIGAVMLHPGWVQTDMGGPNAPLALQDAAASIARTISSLSVADTGRFVRWDGHDHPW